MECSRSSLLSQKPTQKFSTNNGLKQDGFIPNFCSNFADGEVDNFVDT